jgi:Icc-related predicted phosphoesterase
MTLTLISDTHGQHQELPNLPPAEVLIHAGDFCHGTGSRQQAVDFLEWFDGQDYKYKILISGNHDFIAYEHPEEFRKMLPPSITYLEDSGVLIEGYQFWGSPVQPDLTGWAFGKERGTAMARHWKLMPDHVDVLITHTPPAGVLDKSRSGRSLGCEELSKSLKTAMPKLHVFGHIHFSYGAERNDNTQYVNAASMRSGVGLANAPVWVEI